jgi:hypothetical protein
VNSVITQNEYQIILKLRTLKPHERIEIIADQWGRPDYYLVHSQEKKVFKRSQEIEIQIVN